MRVLIISASREFIHVMVAPIGEACIAAALLEYGHEVRIVELVHSEDFRRSIEDAVWDFRPQLVGISLRNIDSATYPGNLFFYLPARNVIIFTRDLINGDVPVVLGGAGFSLFPEEILRNVGLSLGVIGEGELVFAEIARRIERGEDPRGIERGVCFLDEHGTFRQRPPWIVEDLDSLPLPARTLIHNVGYRLPLTEDGSAWGNVQTKRGCNKDCIYCSYRYLEGRSVRYRGPERVADEIEVMVKELGIRKLFIVDSLLNLDAQHLHRMCEAILARSLDVEWAANVAPDIRLLKLLPLMKRSGAAHLAVGIESLSGEMLAALGKDRVEDDALAMARACAELEIEHLTHILLGGPGETVATVRATLERLDSIEPYSRGGWQGDADGIIFTGLRIYPHTRLQRLAEEQGLIPRGASLLKPRFYISPTISEVELFEEVRSFCDAHPRWMAPGLGLNPPAGFAEISQQQFARYQG